MVLLLHSCGQVGLQASELDNMRGRRIDDLTNFQNPETGQRSYGYGLIIVGQGSWPEMRLH